MQTFYYKVIADKQLAYSYMDWAKEKPIISIDKQSPVQNINLYSRTIKVRFDTPKLSHKWFIVNRNQR